MRYLLALALAAGLLLPAAASARAPRLSIATVAPLTIKGAGFLAAERVRVVVTHNGSTTRWTVTNRLGAFTIRLPMTIPPCEVFVVRASGSRGDGALLRVRPPECPQPPTP